MYKPLHYVERSHTRKVDTTFMMLRQQKGSDGYAVTNTLDFAPVEFKDDESLLISDFSISALVTSKNIDALQPVRLGDNDRFGSAAAVQSFTSIADAAAAYLNLQKGGHE